MLINQYCWLQGIELRKIIISLPINSNNIKDFESSYEKYSILLKKYCEVNDLTILSYDNKKKTK